MSIDSIWEEFHGSELNEIRPFFYGMWALDKDDEATRQVIQDAIVNCHGYVLKTQREGGGHNYFGDDVATQLQKEDELWKYSLMKRIVPVSFQAVLMRNAVVWSGSSVSELGIFGTLLAKVLPRGEEIQNLLIFESFY